MSMSKYVAASIGVLAACAPSFGAERDQEAMVVYARPHVVSAPHLAAEIRDSGRTSCDLGFVPGRATLDLASYAQVQELAAMLRDDPELRIAITIRGSATANPRMARERAAVLVATLRDLDVMPRRVIAAPMSDPVAVAFNVLAQRAALLD